MVVIYLQTCQTAVIISFFDIPKGYTPTIAFARGTTTENDSNTRIDLVDINNKDDLSFDFALYKDPTLSESNTDTKTEKPNQQVPPVLKPQTPENPTPQEREMPNKPKASTPQEPESPTSQQPEVTPQPEDSTPQESEVLKQLESPTSQEPEVLQQPESPASQEPGVSQHPEDSTPQQPEMPKHPESPTPQEQETPQQTESSKTKNPESHKGATPEEIDTAHVSYRFMNMSVQEPSSKNWYVIPSEKDARTFVKELKSTAEKHKNKHQKDSHQHKDNHKHPHKRALPETGMKGTPKSFWGLLLLAIGILFTIGQRAGRK
ncbi:hypothetical protein [Staphylococcus coagulans]|uniref:hypothetical protein n=1 Tax=Staphylococcus coagulans TaxID=74706 RepID=UPI0015FB868E|nr:hypothetical protein [Staphylococcus coagulans]MBA8762621.1 hypothetical protein [Staphylococcus coagulans]